MTKAPKIIEVPYTPNAKQEQFHANGATEVVYGGAKGGGKSCALVMETLAYALEYPNAQIYLFRETYDDLEANLIREWKEKVPKELYTYHESKHIATLYNGSKVNFRYIRSTADADGYQGRSMDFIGVDELTKYEEEAIQTILSCLRSPQGYPPRFRGTCNPGGIGHSWVKKRYIDPTKRGEKTYKDKISGNEIAFIPATVYDNTVLMENDPAYVRRLENLPEMRRKAFLMGDWDAYEDQAFEEFDVNIHVCKPFLIPEHWRRWASVDNGYDDPFAWYCAAVSEDGTVYIYREFTREKDEPKLTYSDQATAFMELCGYKIIEDGEVVKKHEKIDYIVAGLDAWHTHVRDISGKTLVDYYLDGGIKYGFIKAVTDRKLGKATVHEYLKPHLDENTEKYTAKLQIFDTCTRLIETLPQLPKDEKDPEKVADCSIDHWYDSLRYLLLSYHVEQTKPLPEEIPLIRSHKDKLAQSSSKFRRKLI